MAFKYGQFHESQHFMDFLPSMDRTAEGMTRKKQQNTGIRIRLKTQMACTTEEGAIFFVIFKVKIQTLHIRIYYVFVILNTDGKESLKEKGKV